MQDRALNPVWQQLYVPSTGKVEVDQMDAYH